MTLPPGLYRIHYYTPRRMYGCNESMYGRTWSYPADVPNQAIDIRFSVPRAGLRVCA